MEQEQLNEILKAFESFKKTDILSAVIICVALIGLIFLSIYFIQRDKKLKAWRKEYESTLTEEERKKLNYWKELNK